MHLRLPVGQLGPVPERGHFGGEVVARPVAPLDETEADQKGTETGGGGYPHGGACFCKVNPVFQGGKVLPPPPPPPQPATATVVPAKDNSKSKRRK